jgi:hypothetical protein
MEHTPSSELIKQLKWIKQRDEITYPRIQEKLEKHGYFVSMTTIRRVFADGSEESSFNYENTLLPIARVLLDFSDDGSVEEEPSADEVAGLRAVIRLQTEEIERLHELNEHLEARVTFLIDQIEKKDRRMDEKDEIIRRLMDKVL